MTQPTNETTGTTERKRRGAPRGNANRQTHGLRAWVVVNKLPKQCSNERDRLYEMRDDLSTEVCRVYGAISVTQGCLIHSALRHEGRALLLAKQLRTDLGLTSNEKLAILRELGNATDSRDKCIMRLELDAKSLEAADPWAAIDAPGAWQAHPDGMHETASTALEDPQHAPGRDEMASSQSEATEPGDAADAARDPQEPNHAER